MSTGTIVQVDPTTLIVAANIREDTKLSKGFLASVKLHGVKVPIMAWETPEGYAVEDGQRRTLAAVDGGLTAVPVYVIGQAASEAERITAQLVINNHRAELTDGESVAAVKQLELFGMTATAIAKKTGYTKATVEVAVKVGASDVASAAMHDHSVTLDQAAVLLEFEDEPEVVQDLLDRLQTAGVSAFTHRAQQKRDERAETAAKAVVLAEAEEAGLQVLGQRPSYSDIEYRTLEQVYTSPELSTKVTLEQALTTAKADLFVFPLKTSAWGEPLKFEAGYALRSWGQHSWFAYEHGTGSGAKAELTEAEKLERREGREKSKLWASASTVRVGWIKEMLQRKTMPAGWEVLVASDAIRNHGRTPTQWRMILSMVGKAGESDTDYGASLAIGKHLSDNPTRAAQIALAIALGSVEGEREFDKKGWQLETTARKHLQALAGWGYGLSEVEQSIVDTKKA
jgi:ParB family transcriptional regulator, chromosome partitioning protein